MLCRKSNFSSRLNLCWFVHAELLCCFRIKLHCNGTFTSNYQDWEQFLLYIEPWKTNTHICGIHKTETRTHFSITSNIPCGVRSRSTRESEVITHLGYMSITTRIFISSIAGGLWATFSMILRFWPLLFHSLSVPLHIPFEDVQQAPAHI